ncbi:uncharacterized protein [Prorops nasuta]|uniref:uncharacterized protein n=1 Tax=Prorops nasuta TaxID=863751 RepID=UPI0034CE9192
MASRKKPPTFKELINFLECTIQALLSVDSESNPDKPTATAKTSNNFSKQRGSIKAHHSGVKSKLKTQQTNQTNTNSLKCPPCTSEHYIGHCDSFRGMKPIETHSEVRRLGLCFNCLGRHQVRSCTPKRSCKRFNGTHHTLLHNDNAQVNVEAKASISSPPIDTIYPTGLTRTCLLADRQAHIRNSVFLLPIVQAILIGASGQHLRIRALLDQGSESTFLSESIVQFLRLSRQRVHVPIIGVGGSENAIASSCVSFRLQSATNNEFEHDFDALVLIRPSTSLPSSALSESDLSLLRDLPWADPNFHMPGVIDVILGVDAYTTIIR